MIIHPGHLTLQQLRSYWQNPSDIALDQHCLAAIEASWRCVQDKIQQNITIYGVNTGFGRLANQRINEQQLITLQHNLLRSHACGTGPLISETLIRLILLLKTNSLAQGYSGVPYSLIEALINLHNKQL